jgi:hypothetical protein
MKYMILIMALLFTGLEAKAEVDGTKVLETGLLVAAEMSLFADMLQTLDIKRHRIGYPQHSGQVYFEPMEETNPILGSHPSDLKIIAYFASAGVLTAAAWRVIPSKWRMLVPVVVLALQIPQVERNRQMGLSIRF